MKKIALFLFSTFLISCTTQVGGDTSKEEKALELPSWGIYTSKLQDDSTFVSLYRTSKFQNFDTLYIEKYKLNNSIDTLERRILTYTNQGYPLYFNEKAIIEDSIGNVPFILLSFNNASIGNVSTIRGLTDMAINLHTLHTYSMSITETFLAYQGVDTMVVYEELPDLYLYARKLEKNIVVLCEDSILISKPQVRERLMDLRRNSN